MVDRVTNRAIEAGFAAVARLPLGIAQVVDDGDSSHGFAPSHFGRTVALAVGAKRLARNDDPVGVVAIGKPDGVEVVVDPAVQTADGVMVQTAVNAAVGIDSKQACEQVMPGTRDEHAEWPADVRVESDARRVIVRHAAGEVCVWPIRQLLPIQDGVEGCGQLRIERRDEDILRTNMRERVVAQRPAPLVEQMRHVHSHAAASMQASASSCAT